MLHYNSRSRLMCMFLCLYFQALEALSVLLMATGGFSGIFSATLTEVYFDTWTGCFSRGHSHHSSAKQSSAMLCSWAMAASSFRNSAYRMMANTRLLAWVGMEGQGGRTPRGGRARAFLTEPLGRDGTRMMSPP